MKKGEIINHLNIITRYLLIFLFTYTAISKLIDHESFLTSILQSPIIRNQATLVSWSVPVLELLIVAMLLEEKFRNMALMLSLSLMIIFTFYIAYMVLFVPHLPCSCGGVLKELSWGNHILFNCFFIILIITALPLNFKHKLFIAINRTSRKPVKNSRLFFLI